jgi:hypothetical protein
VDIEREAGHLAQGIDDDCPKVMFGTKRPSITSRCSISAQELSGANFFGQAPKSAGRMEGAILTAGMGLFYGLGGSSYTLREATDHLCQYAIVTDSTCDLPAALVEAHGITVVPLTVFFGEEALLDSVEITVISSMSA